jgi:hypothetical protein
MLIRVMYKDKTHDYVKDTLLDNYLKMGKVAKFQRSTSWVTIGIDPIRTSKRSTYNGPERRAGTLTKGIGQSRFAAVI